MGTRGWSTRPLIYYRVREEKRKKTDANVVNAASERRWSDNPLRVVNITSRFTYALQRRTYRMVPKTVFGTKFQIGGLKSADRGCTDNGWGRKILKSPLKTRRNVRGMKITRANWMRRARFCFGAPRTLAQLKRSWTTSRSDVRSINCTCAFTRTRNKYYAAGKKEKRTVRIKIEHNTKNFSKSRAVFR